MNIFRLLGIYMLVAGCSTVTYSGPRRPGEQVATIRTSGTDIVEIDGIRWPSSKGDFEMLPGPHSLLVYLNTGRSTGPYSQIRIYSKYPQRVCFVAKPGHNYLMSPNDHGNGQWEPQIFDQATLFSVTIHHPKPGQADCRTP